jgi:DNA-binding transcriptional MerR regulator
MDNLYKLLCEQYEAMTSQETQPVDYTTLETQKQQLEQQLAAIGEELAKMEQLVNQKNQLENQLLDIKHKLNQRPLDDEV